MKAAAQDTVAARGAGRVSFMPPSRTGGAIRSKVRSPLPGRRCVCTSTARYGTVRRLCPSADDVENLLAYAVARRPPSCAIEMAEFRVETVSDTVYHAVLLSCSPGEKCLKNLYLTHRIEVLSPRTIVTPPGVVQAREDRFCRCSTLRCLDRSSNDQVMVQPHIVHLHVGPCAATLLYRRSYRNASAHAGETSTRTRYLVNAVQNRIVETTQPKISYNVVRS
jgi:hypothetical protein